MCARKMRAADSPHYELLEPLGEGAFGSVRRAVHRPTGLMVAVKLLRRADPESVRMLLAEASALAKVRHPNVAQLLDVGLSPDGNGYLVIELVRGHDFEAWLERWPGWPKVLPALLGVLDGLAAAHAAGVVHRDLKPPNLLLDARDGALRVVDFGIATVMDPLLDSGETVVAGTPEFMAPEQLGGGGLGPWTDLYAFGVLLHHVLFAASPYDPDLVLPLLLQAKRTYVPDAQRAARPGLQIPLGLTKLMDALLSPEPRDRPRFAAAVRRELSELGALVRDHTVPHQPVPDETLPDDGSALVENTASPEGSSGPTLIDLAFAGTALGAPPRAESKGTGEVTVERPVPDAVAARDSLFPPTRSVHAEPRSSSPDAIAALPAPDDPRQGASLVRLREVPLIAREDEQAVMRQLIEETCRGGGVRTLLLVGEPGIGKSRLARWGLSEVERLGLMQGTAAGYELDGVGVGGGLQHLLSRLVGGSAGQEHGGLAWLKRRDPGLDVDKVRALVSPGSHATLPSKVQLVDLTRRVLRATSKDAPLYVWVDDLGWARDGAIDLVRALLAEGDVPILFVATLRASTAEHTSVRRSLAGIVDHPRTTLRVVSPLDLAARASLLTAIAPVSPEVRDALAKDVEGSPLLLVQLVRDWMDSERLVASDRGLIPAGGKSVATLLLERPPAHALDARIDRWLSAFGASRDLAEAVLVRAALLGGAFTESTLVQTAASAELRALIPMVLDRSVLAGLLRAEEGALAFEHGLVRENLLARLPGRGDERALVFDVANGVMASFGKDRADVAYSVAGLLRRAGRTDGGWDRLLHAIERAGWVGDVAAAETYLAEAYRWNDEDVARGLPSRLSRIQLGAAGVEYMASRYEAARDALAKARQLAVADGQTALLSHIDMLAADIAYYENRFRDALSIASQVLGGVSDTEDPELMLVASNACHRLSEVEALRGNIEGAYELRKACLAHAARSGVAARERLATLGLAELSMVCGRYDEARALLLRVSVPIASASDLDQQNQGIELFAFLELLGGGDVDRARAALELRLHAVEELGERWRITGLEIPLAFASALADDDRAVSEHVGRMLAAFDAMPHDGPVETETMRRLIGRLEGRGLPELAAACRSRHEARMNLARASFGQHG